MTHYELNSSEKQRRKTIVEQTKQTIMAQMHIKNQNEASIMTNYRDYYLQISFSDLHPLMVFCLAKALSYPSTPRQYEIINDLNLKSVLGSHAINDEVGCYSYRATHWLDTELEASRFYEILDRCVDEANRGFVKITV